MGDFYWGTSGPVGPLSKGQIVCCPEQSIPGFCALKGSKTPPQTARGQMLTLCEGESERC